MKIPNERTSMELDALRKDVDKLRRDVNTLRAWAQEQEERDLPFILSKEMLEREWSNPEDERAWKDL